MFFGTLIKLQDTIALKSEMLSPFDTPTLGSRHQTIAQNQTIQYGVLVTLAFQPILA
jgi:hypothetical protein